MKIEMGKTLKELRLKNGITQEKLAGQLSVTPQAVSRWESGLGYPDIETVPLLAEVLETSTDTLFGIDKKSDELQKYKNELMGRVSRMEWRQRIGEMRTAHETYPSDEDFIFHLGVLLCQAAVNQRKELSEDEKRQYYQEADILLNRILETSTDDKKRETSKALLVQELYSVYDTEKAIKMADKLSLAGMTMQNQKMPLLKGGERAAFAKRWLPTMLLQLFSFVLLARDCSYNPHDKNYETSLEEIQKRKDMYEAVYSYLGHDFTQRKNSDMFHINTFLGLYKKSENDGEALTAVEQYVELCGNIEDEIKEFGANSSAVMNLQLVAVNDEDFRIKLTSGEFKTFGELYHHLILSDKKQRAEHFKDNPRFKAAMEQLKSLGPSI